MPWLRRGKAWDVAAILDRDGAGDHVVDAAY